MGARERLGLLRRWVEVDDEVGGTGAGTVVVSGLRAFFCLAAACAAFFSFFLRLRFSSFAASLFRLLVSSISARCALVLMTKAGAGTSSSSASDSSSSISESDTRLLRLTIAEEQRGLQCSSSSEEKKAILSGGMILGRFAALTCVFWVELAWQQLVGALESI